MRDVFRSIAIAPLVAAALATGCSSQQDTIAQSQKKLESLGATVQLVGEDWLAGQLRGTFTKTALEQVFAHVERERTTLAARPQTLLDDRAARLSQSAEQLSRLVARLIHDVDGADADDARRLLASIPIVPERR